MSRLIYIENNLYTISNSKIEAHDLSALRKRTVII
ncbi:hypothetical protein KHA80_22110 [Anaerobacillus sp. HL2]|nr:hypothetical protein KHA80_22110 [Anaerobacillus sp. HL2]